MQLQTNIGNLNLLNFAAGKQSQCVRLESYENHPNTILKLAGENKNFTEDEVDTLIAETKSYRQELTDAGVRLPANHFIDKTYVGGEWIIIMVDEFLGTGKDVKKELGQNGNSALIPKMINFLHDLPAGEYDCSTAILGDFKPDNWVYDEVTKDLVFIDYFAPKRFGKEGLVTPYMDKIDTFSKEAITFLCGDRRGQVCRLLALIRRDHPGYSDYAIQSALSIYTDMPEVADFIKDQVAGDFKQIDEIYNTKESDWTMKL